MTKKQTVRDLDVLGKRVFLRSDLNVPLNKDGSISDDTRIVRSLDTMRYLLDRGARVVLASHLGRPEAKGDASLAPVVERLRLLLPNTKITLAPDVVGLKVDKLVKDMKDGEMLVLENVRWYKEEKKNDPGFAKTLASYADFFVNDAFGAAHRAHASTAGIAKHIPAVAGLLVEREIKILGEAISNPRRPLTIIMGGKKVSDKIGVIEAFLPLADNIIIGGGMSYTFAKAAGGEIGSSLLDEPSLEYCGLLVKKAKTAGVNLVLPVDTVSGDGFGADVKTQTTLTGKIPAGYMGMDLGTRAIEDFKKVIAKSGTIIWNGPMGVFEFDAFANGTREVARAIVESNAVSIIGGGDSAAAAVKFGLADKFAHISTGGGASLEFFEGKELPGIAVLLDKGVV